MASFSRAMKINSPRDYSRVFRKCQQTGGGGLTVLTAKNKVGHPRLGLAVAKKHLKLAIHRNQLKRIIRESFRQNQVAFADVDIIVLSRSGVEKYDSTQIWTALEKHWKTVVRQWEKS